MTLSNERGSALIITLMLLVILSAIGIYAISISTTEMSIALQSKTGIATLNTAESGAHYAIDMIPIELPSPCTSINMADQSIYCPTSGKTGSATFKPGFSANYCFPDYYVDSIGIPPAPSGPQREVYAVVNYGPVPLGTMY